MAAGAADYFKKASNGVRPVPTTLSAIHSTGGTTLTCVALTGWATTTGVSFCVYTTDTNGNKVAGTQTDWSGVVSGSTITNISLKGGTDQNYSIGAVVEAAPIAGWADDIATGALVQHNQDGTHAVVTATSVAATGDINASTVSSLKDTGIALSTYRNESQFGYTVGGTGVWSGDAYASTRAASMTAWTGYINGQRGTISAVTARSFTASKDTYVDVLNTAGVFTLVYTEVTNNAASPALAANSMRIAIIVTGASNIADAGSVNQGSPTAVLPIASSIPYSVTDSLGNLIYNTSPNPTLLSYRQQTSNATNNTTTPTQIPALSCPVIVPNNRRIKITAYTFQATNAAAGGQVHFTIWDGVVNSGTQLQDATTVNTGTQFYTALVATAVVRASGSKTYNAGVHELSGGTTTLSGGATTPMFIMVELV